MKRIVIGAMLFVLPQITCASALAGNSQVFHLKATIPVIVGVNTYVDEPAAEEAKKKNSIKSIKEEVLRNDKRVILVTLIED
jgi:hypothetical protein